MRLNQIYYGLRWIKARSNLGGGSKEDNAGFPSEIMRLAKLIAFEACELKREEEVILLYSRYSS